MNGMNLLGVGIKMNDVKIEGVVIKPLKKIPDERGSIYHMLRCDDPLFEEFGEISDEIVRMNESNLK